MAVDTRIPNIERIRELQALFTQEAFAKKCGISRQTLKRIYDGHRVDLDTLKAIAAAFDLDIENLILPEPTSDRLCDRISRYGSWPDMADSLRQIVIIMGASAMRTYTQESRKLIGTGLGDILLETIQADDEPTKNRIITADVEATVAGTRTADLLMKPFADKFVCGISYLTEELTEHGNSITPYLGEVANRIHGPGEFFRHRFNVLRLIADPLDGSMNHKRGIPLFCAAAALLVDDQPRVSAIFDAVHNIVYSAVLAGPYEKPEQRASASAWEINTGHTADMVGFAARQITDTLRSEAIAIHLPRNDRDKRRGMIDRLDVLSEIFDSVYALNAGIPAMVLVAKGGLAAFANLSTNLHDVAAAEVLCRAAGCLVTDWENKAIRYTHYERTSVLAAKKNVHSEILNLLQPAREKPGSVAVGDES